VAQLMSYRRSSSMVLTFSRFHHHFPQAMLVGQRCL
jgi:hypothetical protein